MPALSSPSPSVVESVAAPAATRAPVVETYFSPKGGCTDAIVARIEKSKSIRVLAYSFTSKPIIAALIVSQQKYGDVKVVLDREDEDSDQSKQLMDAGIPVWIDKMHAIAHQKVMIFDGEITEEGSFNYTQQAETSNSENCNFIHIGAVSQDYLSNWELHQSHSVVPGTTPVSTKKKRFK